ncbi:YqgE/AlgH family protein [Parasphingopyxis algicola]|uniref:YqgE/AlgH family protein n=1 Tax=Parasphingopyxis algicola TaxID=2026624 RepID=UPI0015A43F64|nr:YqgE/AlgH family protein [Parasphingopyxis algicola]QLC24266.1 YqgE/AlgH family protein [Parasphingopyxis algicola]
MDSPTFYSGQLLLALPGMGDPRFERAVIAMCAHDEQGALGIGIGNVIANVGFHTLLNQLEIEVGDAPDAPVHLGGPVEPQRGFIIHSLDWGGEDSVQVGDKWGLTGTLDILRAIAEGRGPERWLSALGYAGWSPGQLDEEMTRHGWFTAEGDADILFDTEAEKRWAESYRRAGVDPALLAHDAGHA